MPRSTPIVPFEIRRLCRKTMPRWWNKCPATMTYGEWEAKRKDFLAERRAAQAKKRKLIREARQRAAFNRWHPLPSKLNEKT